MYAFLSTLDRHLRQHHAMYRPSNGWSRSRSASPWYGYAFAWSEVEPKTRPWWLGFERDGATLLRLYRNGRRRVIGDVPLEVVSAAALVIEGVSAST